MDAFKKALLRICILAHDKLGGQSSQQVEHALEVEVKQKQNQKRVQEYIKFREKERQRITEEVQTQMRAEYDSKVEK